MPGPRFRVCAPFLAALGLVKWDPGLQWVLITWRFMGGYKWGYEGPLRGSCKGFYRVFRVWGFGGSYK